MHALTIDVEDYFQTEAVTRAIPRSEWHSMELRVGRNTWRLLEMLDASNVRVTLFVLGWVAERYPDLIRAAAQAGHEIACHSYWHRPVYRLSAQEFRDDTLRAKDVIEAFTGQPVIGYRAPSFSILHRMQWATDVLADLGFRYSSSSHPIRHDTYSDPCAPRLPYRTQSGIWEIPISTWRVFGCNFPLAGGAYMRILPLGYTFFGLDQVQRSGERMMVYLHPWEIDPEQPRLPLGKKSGFRQYTGLGAMESRLQQLIRRYSFGTVREVYGPELELSECVETLAAERE